MKRQLSSVKLFFLVLFLGMVFTWIKPQNHSITQAQSSYDPTLFASVPTMFPYAFSLSSSDVPIKSGDILGVQSEPTASPTPIPIQSGFCLDVPILFYHHVEPLLLAEKAGHAQLTVDSSNFESQMAYLNSRGYKSLSVDEVVNALINRQQLPPKSIVITLDDGYLDAYTYAFPIFKKYNIVGNVMIPTGLLGNNDYMSWPQLKEMVGSGMVFAYNHSWSHANLAALEKDKMDFEISTPKKQLEDQLGKPSNIFTYPYGGLDSAAIAMLKEKGYIAALSTFPGFQQCDSFLMSLHRNRVGNSPLASYGL